MKYRIILRQVFPLAALALLCLTPALTKAPQPKFKLELLDTRNTPPPGAIATALAKGDFNEDGMPDVVATYAGGSFGTARIYKGNHDWLYGSKQATGPFHETPDSIHLAVRPDFIAAGDFNRDLHHDLIVAASNDKHFLFLEGLGNGEFLPEVYFDLPEGSTITALTSGDFGIEDGAPDLAIATSAGKILLFESLRGSLTVKPYEINAPSSDIRTMAIGRIDANLGSDLAIVDSEGRYSVLSGDDCRFSDRNPAFTTHKGEYESVMVTPAEFAELAHVNAIDKSAGANIRKRILTNGQFVEMASTPVASLAMRLNKDAESDFVFLMENGTLAMATSDRQAALPQVGGNSGQVNSFGDEDDGDLEDGICDAGPRGRPNGICSLRAALQQAQRNGGGEITFEVSSVTITRSLPQLTVRIVVDGGPNKVDIRSAGVRQDGFTLIESAANQSVFRNLAFNNIASAIRLLNVRLSIIEGCVFGLNRDGASQGPAGMVNGVLISNGVLNVVGGTAPGARNLIVSTAVEPVIQLPISISGGEANRVYGNYIGTDITATRKLGRHTTGVQIFDSSKNFVGGLNPGEGNIILGGIKHDASGQSYGVGIFPFNTPAEANRVQQNLIGVGLGSAARQALGADTDGVISPGAFNTIVQFNTISGHKRNGLQISGRSYAVTNNFIGTDPTGSAAVPNLADGIWVSNSSQSATIGGFGGRNIVSGNGGNGMRLDSGGGAPDGLRVGNNYIGVAVDGRTRLQNSSNGIRVSGTSPEIGGLLGSNVISGNGENGIVATFATGIGTRVKGNFIGLGADGITAVGNAQAGIRFDGSLEIGGSTPADRNYISSNGGSGIHQVFGDPSTGNQPNIFGNYIGTDITGLLDRGNGEDGVKVDAIGFVNLGSLDSAKGNLIAFNRRNGVFRKTRGNSIFLSNRVHSNGALGIDTSVSDAPDGPNPQLTGVNRLINSPVLTSASVPPGSTHITGNFIDIEAGTPVLFQFYSSASCDASGFGEGRRLLGTQTVLAQVRGLLTIDLNLPVESFEEFVTATATMGNLTNPSGSNSVSSEFSNCVRIPLGCGPNLSSQVSVTRGGIRFDRTRNRFVQTVTLRNNGAIPMQGPIALAVDNLNTNATLFSMTGTTACAAPSSPYQDVVDGFGSLLPGASVSINLEFVNPTNAAISYSTRVLGRGAR